MIEVLTQGCYNLCKFLTLLGPAFVWFSYMDFQKSKGKTTILAVADRLTKCGHFLAISHSYSATYVRENIISDRDPVFVHNIQQDLFVMQSVTLSTATAYHPQTNGKQRYSIELWRLKIFLFG